MKRLLISILFTLTVLHIISFSQEASKPIFFDKFSDITGEDYSARLDALLSELLKSSNSVGYIIIHRGKNRNGRFVGIGYEQTGKGHIKFRGTGNDYGKQIKSKKIHFIRAENKENVEVNIWIVPEDAEKPNYTEIPWDFTVSPNTKPYIFTTTEWHYGGLSMYPEHLSLNLFAEYLEANPTSRGNFVVNAISKDQYSEEKSKIEKILIEKYKIKQNRLNFFYVHVKKFNLQFPRDYPQIEVWFLPKRIIRK